MTPLPKDIDFDDDCQATSQSPEDRLLFQLLLGNLRYISDGTRLHASFALSRLARHLSKPMERHISLLKHILQYHTNLLLMNFCSPPHRTTSSHIRRR